MVMQAGMCTVLAGGATGSMGGAVGKLKLCDFGEFATLAFKIVWWSGTQPGVEPIVGWPCPSMLTCVHVPKPQRQCLNKRDDRT